MKKIATIMGIFGLILLQAQVGINTDTPKATLDMKKDQSLSETTPQGVLFPRFTTAERTKFTDVEESMVIYNLDKKCLEIYTGVQSGVAQWDCMPGTASASAQNIAVTPVGFDGAYVAGVKMTATNKVKFELKNNSFSGITNVDFSGAVSIVNTGVNTGGVIGVASGENNKVSLAPGASTVLSYSLTGTPVEGRLTANFDKLGLQADQSTQVGWGTATIANKTVYILSQTVGSTTIQGKINNGAEKLTIEIPYTQGQGSYNAFTNTQTSAAGEGGSTSNLTLDIPAGNFGVNGNLTATITVDSEYLVKQQAPGVNYDIVTFPISMGGSTFNVVVKGIGGIPDRNFGNGTHDFVYLPVEVTGTYPVNNQPYKKTWLNLNLGAEYAKVSSNHFNPTINKTGYTMHGDSKLHGNYFTFDEAKLACPVGYRLPTKTEWQDLHQAITNSRSSVSNSKFWNQSIIPNFAAAGYRWYHDGKPYVGTYGYYWSSVANYGVYAWSLSFNQSRTWAYASSNRGDGFSARCLKD